MNQNYPSFSISLEDQTKHTSGFTPAAMRCIQCTDSLSSSRPTLRDIISWVDSQAEKVRLAADEMRRNPGTKTIKLHARLPMRMSQSGLCSHEQFQDIPADGREIEELKAKVIAAYKKSEKR